MDRRTVEPLALAVLAVVALAAAAATLPTAVESGAVGEGGSGFLGGRGDGGQLPTPAPPESLDGLPRTVSVLVGAVLLVALLVALYLLARDRRALRRVGGLIVFLGAIVLLFWLLSYLDLPAGVPPGRGGPLFGVPAGGSGGSPASSPPFAVLLVVGAILLVALAVARRGGRLPGLLEEDEEAAASAEAAEVGQAARRAADRLETSESAAVENEVYRAWREMTGLLELPNPEGATAGEFASAGVEAGMQPGHVAELTRLFEDVRYGGDEPTESVEHRAMAVLRRIEAAYAPEGGDPA